jgi:predicted nucleic acid-binding protein
MILVDTSIWIDHLHVTDPVLGAMLERDEAGIHPLVIEELALGSIARREDVLDLLADLRQFPVLRHGEMLLLVRRHRLWGRSLSAVDVHLLGAVALVPGAKLWTRDKRLVQAAKTIGVPVFDG